MKFMSLQVCETIWNLFKNVDEIYIILLHNLF